MNPYCNKGWFCFYQSLTVKAICFHWASHNHKIQVIYLPDLDTGRFKCFGWFASMFAVIRILHSWSHQTTSCCRITFCHQTRQNTEWYYWPTDIDALTLQLTSIVQVVAWKASSWRHEQNFASKRSAHYAVAPSSTSWYMGWWRVKLNDGYQNMNTVYTI